MKQKEYLTSTSVDEKHNEIHNNEQSGRSTLRMTIPFRTMFPTFQTLFFPKVCMPMQALPR